MTPAEIQAALIGAMIGLRTAKRLRPLVKAEVFDAEADRHLFAVAMNLAAAGLDGDDEYVVHVADTLRFEARSVAVLERALLAFERACDEFTERPLDMYMARLVNPAPAIAAPSEYPEHWNEAYDR